MESLKDKSPQDNDGNTPLHLAALNGHLDVVRFIMENIEDKSPEDSFGHPPLYYATSPEVIAFITSYFISKK